MLGNDTLRESFSAGIANTDIARSYLDWLLTTRRRTPLTVYQYAAKLQGFLTWIEPTPRDAVAIETIEARFNRPRQGRAMGALGAPATIAKDVSLLPGLYRFAVARDLEPAVATQTPVTRPGSSQRPPLREAAHLSHWRRHKRRPAGRSGAV